MNFFGKKDFKTKQQELKKQKRMTLKKQEQTFKSSITNNRSTKATMQSQHPKVTLNELLKGQDQSGTFYKTHNSSQSGQTKKVFFKKQSDGELYYSMEKRLHELQTIKKQQRQQLNKLGQQIQSLKTENTIIQAIHSQIPSFQQRQQIVHENTALKQKMSQMQAYLNANGAFWQGEKLVGQFKIKQVKEHIKSTKLNYRTPSSFQFQTICKRIQQLNQSLLIELGTTKVVSVNGINSFTKAEILKVEFYKNLIRLDSLGCFQYSKINGIKILADLNDGYYPRVCKDKYPNGVLMEIVNNIHLQYNEQIKNGAQKPWFFGKAFTLIDNQ